MPEIKEHVETMFSYSDLQTTDLEGAKRFYIGLFGWDVDEQPMGNDQVYAMFKKKGKVTAAASLQQPQQREAGVPPMWNAYFTVYDVDSRTKEAGRVGGTIQAEPFDVFDAGRMSVIMDPNGAVLCLWQPKDSIGAEVMNEPNSLAWTECVASDVDKGRAFYSDLFGWDTQEMDSASGGVYTLFKKDGRSVCGLLPSPAPGMPSFWLTYFDVANCDDAVAKVQQLGGEIKRPTTSIPGVGRFALIADSQGAGFGLIQPES
jgi:predicted enzyme related to lactoylglutathione lyase